MRATATTALLAALLAVACGSDGSGEGGDGVVAEHWVPRGWAPGSQLGYAVLSQQTKVPTDLRASECALDVQFAVASGAGGLDESDREGTCIVATGNPGWQGQEDTLEPACAGVVSLTFGDTERRLTLCGDRFAPAVGLDCSAVRDAIQLEVTSGPDPIEGDVLESLDVTVPRPAVPTILTPVPQGEGTSVWPEGEDLTLEWEAGTANGVEIVIGQISGTGPQVRCLSADDGSFTVPGRLLAPYRSGTAFVEVAALSQTERVADGFGTRVTYRVSDALWLYAR